MSINFEELQKNEALMEGIKALVEKFIGKSASATLTKQIKNPFGEDDKIVLKLETTNDGKKKLTKDSEYILSLLIDGKGEIGKNLSLDFVCWYKTNNLSRWRDGMTYVEYNEARMNNGEHYQTFMKHRARFEGQQEAKEESMLDSKLLLQFLLAMDNPELIRGMKDIVITILQSDDDALIQAKLAEILAQQNQAPSEPEPEVQTEQIKSEQPKRDRPKRMEVNSQSGNMDTILQNVVLVEETKEVIPNETKETENA